MPLNLKQLEHLLALAETGSFSRAADHLHLTQSALSRSILLLEQELSARLVDRRGRSNELTPIGAEVARRAQRLVLQAEDLRRVTALLQAGHAGPIRVGLGSGPGVMLMTPFLLHMVRHHPDVSVTLTRGSIELQLVQLRERALDALVIDVHSMPPATDLVIEHAAEIRAGFVCRKGHPLLGDGRHAAGFEQLRPFPIAATPLADEVGHILMRHFGPQANPQRAVRVCCEEVASLLETVRGSDAIFLGIVAAARPGIAAGELAELATDPPLRLSARYAIVTLAGRTESPSMQLFRRFVAEHLRD